MFVVIQIVAGVFVTAIVSLSWVGATHLIKDLFLRRVPMVANPNTTTTSTTTTTTFAPPPESPLAESVVDSPLYYNLGPTDIDQQYYTSNYKYAKNQQVQQLQKNQQIHKPDIYRNNNFDSQAPRTSSLLSALSSTNNANSNLNSFSKNNNDANNRGSSLNRRKASTNENRRNDDQDPTDASQRYNNLIVYALINYYSKYIIGTILNYIA